MNKTKTLLWACTFMCALACNNAENVNKEEKKNETPTAASHGVLPPFEFLNVPTVIHSFDNATGGKFEYKTGSVIIIPANAFVTLDGKPVTGKVDISYREFHTPGEVIASGVNMWYDETKDNTINKQKAELGTKHLLASNGTFFGQNVAEEKPKVGPEQPKPRMFETAGMLELRATQNGKDLKLGEGKAIDAKMASYKTGTTFNTYSYNEQGECWNTEKVTQKVVANPEKKKLQDELNAMKKPIAPEDKLKINKGEPLFSLDLNYDIHPELGGFNSVMWQYAGADKDKYIKEHENLFKEKWDNMSIEKENELYKLTLTKGDKKVLAEITPVLTGSDATKAKKNFELAMKNHGDASKKYTELKKYIATVADVFRSFKVLTLGITNTDQPLAEGSTLVTSDFVFSENKDKKQIDYIYIYEVETKSVARSSGKGGHFGFLLDKKKTYIFFSMLSSRIVLWFSKHKYIQNIRPVTNYTSAVQMENSKFEISSVSSLDQFISVYASN